MIGRPGGPGGGGFEPIWSFRKIRGLAIADTPKLGRKKPEGISPLRAFTKKGRASKPQARPFFLFTYAAFKTLFFAFAVFVILNHGNFKKSFPSSVNADKALKAAM
jgi:hypothetical protein